MKNLFITALLLSGIVLNAQKGERSDMHKLSAEQVATLHTKKLTLALDLSKSQQRDIQKLNEENAKLRKEKMEARKTARAEEGHKDLNTDEKFNRQVQQLDRAIAHKAQMKNILSEEQYVKWEKIQMKKSHHRKSGRIGKRSHEEKRRG